MSRRNQRINGPLPTNDGSGKSVAYEPYNSYTTPPAQGQWGNMMTDGLLVTNLIVNLSWELVGTFFLTIVIGMSVYGADRASATGVPAALVILPIALTQFALAFLRRDEWLPGHYDPGYTWLKLVQKEIGIFVALGYWVAQYGGAMIAYLALGVGANTILGTANAASDCLFDNFTAPFASRPFASIAAGFFMSFFGNTIIYLFVAQFADGKPDDIKRTRLYEGIMLAVISFAVRTVFYQFGLVSFNSAVNLGLVLTSVSSGMTATFALTLTAASTIFLFLAANWVSGIVAGLASAWLGMVTETDSYDQYTNRISKSRKRVTNVVENRRLMRELPGM